MLQFRFLSLVALLLLLSSSGQAQGSDLLFAPLEAEGGPVDSASILRSELEDRGRVVVRCDSLTGFVLSNYDAIWVCLGVYPYNHPLTFNEGLKLKEYLESGGTLMIEGGDIWGYDILTPLNTIDGISASADGGSNLSSIDGVLGENGVDLSGFSATYTGENTNLDHIYADLPGASVVFSKTGGAYHVGVLHVGAQSSLADFQLLGNSFEFGGVAGDRAEFLEAILIALDLEADCNFLAPTTPRCEWESQRLQLTWQNLTLYSALEVVRDEVTIAILPPTVSSYVDIGPPGGFHEYRVRAFGGEECTWLSGACFIDLPEPDVFRRGDTNHNGSTNITDAVQLLAALFVPDSLLDCPDAGDVNDSGALDISDAVLLLRHVFEGGTPPAAPVNTCGIDPTHDSLPSCIGTCIP